VQKDLSTQLCLLSAGLLTGQRGIVTGREERYCFHPWKGFIIWFPYSHKFSVTFSRDPQTSSR